MHSSTALPLLTISSSTSPASCARPWHAGTPDISSVLAAGAVPSKITFAGGTSPCRRSRGHAAWRLSTRKVIFDARRPRQTLDMSAVRRARPRTDAGEVERADRSSGKGVKNAFGVDQVRPAADKSGLCRLTAVSLTQEGCMYSPHVDRHYGRPEPGHQNADPTTTTYTDAKGENADFNHRSLHAADIEHNFPREEVLSR